MLTDLLQTTLKEELLIVYYYVPVNCLFYIFYSFISLVASQEKCLRPAGLPCLIQSKPMATHSE